LLIAIAGGLAGCLFVVQRQRTRHAQPEREAAGHPREDGGVMASPVDPGRSTAVVDEPGTMQPHAGLLEVDVDGWITALDDQATRLLGATDGELHVSRILPDLVTDEHGGGLRIKAGESRLLREGGHLEVDVMVAPWRNGGWLVAIRDASAQRRRLLELERLALHDPLTGLANRTLLADRAEQAMALADRRGDPLAVLLLDLDRFKQVNDTLGHEIGDQLLQEVAPRLEGPLRRTDTLARIGGDEFAVLLPPPTSSAEAVEVARRLVDAMRPQFLIDGFSLGVGVSIGIALRPKHGHDLDSLLRSADQAMYAAKRDALGLVLAGDPAELGVIRGPALRDDIERAIAERSLAVYFQPKVEAGSRRVAGFEGLLRWNHPSHGWLKPDVFLPVAERARLMGPLTEFVLDECLRWHECWRGQGHRLEVAANLASFWLRDDRVVDQIGSALTRWGTPRGDLTLDVTERSIMSDPVRARQRLSEFRAMGCRVAMDDFGTGYSSLVQLQSLPLNEVKVHRSFIAPLEDGSASARIVFRSIVGIAQGLGLTATAEGVESEEVARSVAELGCEWLQGFLIAEPMRAEETLAWLDRCADGVPHQPADRDRAYPTPMDA
jgi:diguanylate cyclase (GGDEF)-like protein